MRPCKKTRHPGRLRGAIAACLLQALAGAGPLHAAPVELSIAIDDGRADHVHQPGAPIALGVRIDPPHAPAVHYQWRDFSGVALTPPRELRAGVTHRLRSPRTEVGYYALVFLPATGLVLPQRRSGEERSYGFVILPPRRLDQRAPDADSRFGVVHARFTDPNLPPWIKTLTWKTLEPAQWRAALAQRRAAGALELPLVLGREWESDDAAAIAPAQLAAIEARSARYFEQDPAVRYWELGLEENLRGRFREPWYWANLEAKVAAVRRAAARVEPAIRLVYQIAELDLAPVRRFARSDAARLFDVLSLHPYAWPDFPPPEQWLGRYLARVRGVLRAERLGALPIWFTEVGVPQRGNHPQAFFGNPGSGQRVPGLDAAAVVDYLIKLHVIALHEGVARIFWYNYRDRGAQREDVEQHFGLRDYWGYPKPAYAAYVNLHRRLERKRPQRAWRLPGGVRAYAFGGGSEQVLVAWSEAPRGTDLPLSALPSLAGAGAVRALNAVGTPLALDGAAVALAAHPLFLIAGDPEPAP